jgi:glycogen(starch) synthase
MRIVFISREHRLGVPGGGGIGTYTSAIAPALARLGHDVSVVTWGDGGETSEDGVRILRLRHRPSPSAPPGRLRAALRVAAAARELEADVVQAAEWEAEAWWLARRGTIPVVTRLATPTYLAEWLNRGRPGPGTDLVRRMEADQARRSRGLVAPSRAIADRVAADWGLPRPRIEVIRNPIDGAAIRAAAAGDPGLDLPARFVAFTGRLERRKGIHVLAEALPRVFDAHRDVHVVLVGRDAGDQGAAALAGRLSPAQLERVHVLGHLPRDAALQVAARSELVVLPSLWEAFGFVAAEALAVGRPVVATGGSGFAEIVEDGRSGWLVPPGDAGALAEVLIERLGDPAALAAAGVAASERAGRFEVAEVAEELAGYYRRVLEEGEPAGIDSGIYERDYRRWFRPDDRGDTFYDLYERKRRAVLAELDAAPRLRILDAGGGPGRLACPLAARHDVTLCDISADMLAEARSRCPEGVRFVQADARALPFADGEFDALLALDLLVHLPDLSAAVLELARVVRPGGRLLIDTTNATPWWVLAYPSYVDWRPRRLVRTMRSGGVLPEWRPTVTHWRPSEMRAALGAAGLQLERRLDFGPPWTPRWQLWLATKPAA